MLRKKMLRELRQNFGQFFSLFLLVALSTMMYTGFMSDPIGGGRARERFHEETALGDAWVYGEGFSEEQLEAVRALPFIDSAQLRMGMTGSAPEQGGAEMDLYLETEDLVSKPLLVEGAPFDPEDPDGIWLNRNFADAWQLHVGDAFTVEYGGVRMERPIRGLVLSPEYEYMCASTDADTNFENIGYAYLAYSGFPAKEFLEHQIENDKITAEDIKDNPEIAEEIKNRFPALGFVLDHLTKDMMLTFVRSMSDEDIGKMMPYTQMVLRGKDGEDLIAHEEEIAGALDHEYAVLVDRTSMPGIQRLTAELEQHASFSYAFMIVFIAIAILVIVTSMGRMVERQRTQIGTMNALGLDRKKITLHYLSYSFAVAFAGGLAGALIGYFFLGKWIVSMFREWYVVTGWEAGADWTFAAVVAVITLICVLAAWISCRKLLRVSPSAALRPAPPKEGKRTVFERLPFWDRLGFSTRYNLRDISRYKLRAVMGIFGTAVGMMLLTSTVGALALLDSVYEWSFEKIQNFAYEAMLGADMKLADADALSRQLDGELVMQAGIEIAAKEHAVGSEKSTQVLTVTEGKGLYRLTDPKTNVTELPEGTCAVTNRLAKNLGVHVGDTVYWHIYEQNEWHSSVVGLINRTPETSGMTLLRSDFEAAGCEFAPTLLATNDAAILDAKEQAGRDKAAADAAGEATGRDGAAGEAAGRDGATGQDGSAADWSGVSAVYSVSELREVYEEQMSIIWALIVAMVIFAVAMIVTVLYNSGNLSFHERIQEFATLRVLGFSAGRIRSLLTRQNFWLSLIGIAAGAPFANAMLEAMMNSNGENFDYYIRVTPLSYLLGGLVVLCIAMAVSFLFTGKIRKLDMVGTLKGAE